MHIDKKFNGWALYLTHYSEKLNDQIPPLGGAITTCTIIRIIPFPFLFEFKCENLNWKVIV